MKTAMNKKINLKSALAASIGAEQQSVADRFKRAESLLGEKAPEPQAEPPASLQETLASDQATPRKLPAALPKIERVIRDSFTMPENDHRRIAELQERCLQAGVAVTKSEIVRAGLIALQKLPLADLRQYVEAVEKMKPGRPSG